MLTLSVYASLLFYHESSVAVEKSIFSFWQRFFLHILTVCLSAGFVGEVWLVYIVPSLLNNPSIMPINNGFLKTTMILFGWFFIYFIITRIHAYARGKNTYFSKIDFLNITLSFVLMLLIAWKVQFFFMTYERFIDFFHLIRPALIDAQLDSKIFLMFSLFTFANLCGLIGYYLVKNIITQDKQIVLTHQESTLFRLVFMSQMFFLSTLILFYTSRLFIEGSQSLYVTMIFLLLFLSSVISACIAIPATIEFIMYWLNHKRA